MSIKLNDTLAIIPDVYLFEALYLFWPSLHAHKRTIFTPLRSLLFCIRLFYHDQLRPMPVLNGKDLIFCISWCAWLLSERQSYCAVLRFLT